jgi:hypothetical protein
MPRYYFHVRRGQVTFIDQEGVECDGIEEATKEAARRAWEIEAREAQANLPSSTGSIIVEDEFGARVLERLFGGVRFNGHATATLACLGSEGDAPVPISGEPCALAILFQSTFDWSQ